MEPVADQVAAAPPRVVAFEVLGAPVPCARARVVRARGRAHAYTPARTAEFEQLVRLVAMTAVRRVEGWRTDAPGYRFELVVYRAARRGDWDNFAKAVADALQGVVFDDDRAIVEAHVRLELDRVRPRVAVRIEILDAPVAARRAR
ncbi:MAG TPA: RusA family crossover junction endodeoxyribonuclease [Byssovorax sp.]